MSEQSKTWADMLFEQAKAHQECYIAGMKAADGNSPSARKLARLIAEVERALDDDEIPYGALRAALQEARR